MEQYIEFISNHYLLALALVVVSYLILQDLFESVFSKHEGLSPLLAVTRMNSIDTVIVDVREPPDFIKGHIENAINLPLGKFSEKLASIEEYKKQTIIVVCQSGSKSVSACKTLTKENFEKVFNITGGMQSWGDSNLPIQISSKKKS